MTTPAQDAPLVFPSVAFRPLRLLAICVLFAGLVTLAAGLLGHPMVGVFFGIGLTIAFIFRPQGLGVVFGMALFQVLLVISTALPVMKKLRAGVDDGPEGEATQ